MAFLIAAIFAAVMLLREPQSSQRRAEWALVAVIATIGVGSFLFHTYATRWASVADTAPIGLFMIGYLGYSSRRYLGASWLATAILLGVFVAAMRAAGDIPCSEVLLPITAAAGRPCFNGSLGYLPALIALILTGLAALLRGHAAARSLFLASALLAVSLTLRTLDYEVCAMTELLGRARGTHSLWHLLNATLLFVLARAAIRHGRRRA